MNRLKTRAQFQAVLAGGTVCRTAHFALHATAVPESLAAADVAPHALLALFPGQTMWLGAMVPKRWARRAVTRNAIKRQIYNVSVQFETLLRPCPHVVRLRSAFDKAQFVSASSDRLKQQVRAELQQLFMGAAKVHAAPSHPTQTLVL